MDNEIIILNAWATTDGESGFGEVFTDETEAMREANLRGSELIRGYTISGGVNIRDQVEDLFEDFYRNKEDMNAILVEEGLVGFVTDLSTN
ncbi:hypothetical protein [Paenibacillus polymyxa]|uniref:Uncharacterized protein n=1 Tax=Paenibacillus polymyxa (strain SC2) TaxID=886882 RepID=E3EKN0_PAEPS|nr:hypothetical protein [Paenibacillus polymyxa]ADO59862.1 hypothetical protein PPSC2_25880 [Paenibacillus polymyxa SC2]WPQ59910.1 hypothetical protein SKN87_27080 [Paenibacillus polymyxa]